MSLYSSPIIVRPSKPPPTMSPHHSQNRWEDPLSRHPLPYWQTKTLHPERVPLPHPIFHTVMVLIIQPQSLTKNHSLPPITHHPQVTPAAAGSLPLLLLHYIFSYYETLPPTAHGMKALNACYGLWVNPTVISHPAGSFPREGQG